MQLSVLERILLINLLPKEANVTDLRICLNLSTEMGFSEEEIERLEINEQDGAVRWNAERETLKEVAIGPRAFDIIKDALSGLDRQKKMTPAHIPLYERFVEAEPEVITQPVTSFAVPL